MHSLANAMGLGLELLLLILAADCSYVPGNYHATLTILYVAILQNTAQVVLNASVSHRAAQARTLSGLYSGTPLNGHPSIADTHDITDNSESPDSPPIHFNT